MNKEMIMLATERDFFSKIREAIYSNPFGLTRMEIDLSATGLSSTTGSKEILAKLVYRVGETIKDVRQRQSNLSSLQQDDITLLRFAMLFHAFHLFSADIDDHIEEQSSKSDERCKVSFALPLLKLLHDYTFSKAEAKRFLELFFQMRRAFFFISKIIGSSPCVMNFRRVLWNNVFTQDIKLYDLFLWDRMEDFSTMILGETGTGKGMAAAAIGRSGYIPYDDRNSIFKESFAETFISINLSQFPEQLIESELFGHKKGAFTGAVEQHRGIFSRCSPHGSIFLDEIGDVSPHVQIKLLRVLQDRLFTPVGSHIPEKFHGRVIGATNQSLTKAREEGKFRDDFYYRLCSDVIEVPPLRQRITENPVELKELLGITIARILGSQSQEIVEKIHTYIRENQPEEYQWPGNIRELEQCVRRLLLNGNYAWQDQHGDREESASDARAFQNGSLTAAQLLSRYCILQYRKLGTYGAVAELTELDRRTVKKYILGAE